MGSLSFALIFGFATIPVVLLLLVSTHLIDVLLKFIKLSFHLTGLLVETISLASALLNLGMESEGCLKLWVTF